MVPSQPTVPGHPIGAEHFEDLTLLSADELFAAVGQEFQIPSDLLRALAWVETSFASPASPIDAQGWFGLSSSQYTLAAEITGLSFASLRTERSGGLVAGAALIDHLRNQVAPEAHPAEADASWAPVVQAWPEVHAPWLRQAFVDEIYAVLQGGLIAATEDTNTRDEPDIVVVAPRSIPALSGLQPIPWPMSDHPPEYPAALRLPSPQVSLSGSTPISRIELRLTERSWSESAADILAGDPDALAHYLVRRADGLVSQFVWEERRLPDSPPGTVVIAVAGTRGSPSSITPQVLEGSARLAAYLSWRHGLPLDASTVQGELGDFFPWDGWRDAATCFAGGGGASCPIPSAQQPQGELPEDDGARSDSAERDAAPISVPYFYQYANSLHPSASCQNTSVAMLLSWAGWTGDPDGITARFGKSLAQSPSGLVTVFNTLAAEAGLEARIQANTSGSISGLKALLDSGKPVIVHGYFTSYGHVMVTTGYDSTGYYVNDPAGQWAQTWKGGYPYGWDATVGRGIRYGQAAFEQAVGTSNGSSYLPLWYYDITGVDTTPSGEPSESPSSEVPDEEDESEPVGPEQDDEASPYPWASIDILTPSDEESVGLSFLAEAERTSGKEIQYWSGALKLKDSIYENPGSASLTLPGEGARELVARNVSQWGTVLATDRINLNLEQSGDGLVVHATALGGPKYLFTSTPTVGGVSYVEYYADTFLLDDDWSGDSLGVGEGYPLTYSFEQTGVRAIEAIGYSVSNEVIARGEMTLLVEETAKVASCSIGGSIFCGGSFAGDTNSSMASDVINGYPTIVGNYEGPELGVTWAGGSSGEVEVRLVDPDPRAWDLDILVLDQSSGECVASDVIARGFTSVIFEATGGAYTFVIDGFAGDAGHFELAMDCNP